MTDLSIPGGRSKGTPIAEASAADCEYWGNRCRSDVQTNKSRNPDRDLAIAEACDARLAQLSGKPARGTARGAARSRTQTLPDSPRSRAAAAVGNAPAPRAAAALAVRSPDALASVSGSYRQPQEILRVLREAAEVGHLISPQTSAGELPVGCAISTSVVWIDMQNDTYAIEGGKRGLGKNALNKIASAAGIKWDPILSGRIDDGSDPHYVAWKVVASRRGFDGSPESLVAHGSMDLRDGSAKADAQTPASLAQQRKFIQEHAETKAKNRLIRELGVQTGYPPTAFDKPFIITRLIFTGRSDNPQIEAMFAEKMFDAFHGTGSQPGAARTLYPHRQLARPGFAPPPVGAGDDDLDDDGSGHGGSGHGGYDPDAADASYEEPIHTHDYRADAYDDEPYADDTADDADDGADFDAPEPVHTIPASPPPPAANNTQDKRPSNRPPSNRPPAMPRGQAELKV